MNAEQKAAYEWAKNQNYPSVAAQNAKILANLIESLTAQLTEAREREKAILQDLAMLKECDFCINGKCRSRGGTQPCRFVWRGPQKGEQHG